MFVLLISLFLQKSNAFEKTDPKIKMIDQYLNTQAMKGKFSGSVLIAKNNKILFKKAYGLASREYNYSTLTLLNLYFPPR